MDEDKIIDLRVSGVKEAAARARLAFFITVFACGTIIITLYNNYFQWNRISLDPARGLSVWRRPVDQTEAVANPFKLTPQEQDHIRKRANDLNDEYSRQDARDQTENQTISLSWLGIKLSSADMDVFGSLGLFITSMYYLLCVRRMALEIESLITSVKGSDATTLDYVYLGVRQSFVLNVDADDDLIYNTSAAKRARNRDRGVSLSHWLFPKLRFLPAVTILLNLGSDWYYALVQEGSTYGGGFWWLRNLTLTFQLQFLLMTLLATVVGIGILLLNISTHRLEGNAVNSIRGFFPLTLRRTKAETA